jgi:hypothetical protein
MYAYRQSSRVQAVGFEPGVILERMANACGQVALSSRANMACFDVPFQPGDRSH